MSKMSLYRQTEVSCEYFHWRSGIIFATADITTVTPVLCQLLFYCYVVGCLVGGKF